MLPLIRAAREILTPDEMGVRAWWADPADVPIMV